MELETNFLTCLSKVPYKFSNLLMPNIGNIGAKPDSTVAFNHIMLKRDILFEMRDMNESKE